MPVLTFGSDQIWLKNQGAQSQVWSPAITGIPAGANISSVILTFSLHNSYATPGAVNVYRGSSAVTANRVYHISAGACRNGTTHTVDLTSYITGNGTYPITFHKTGNTSKNYLCFTSIALTVTYTQPASTFTLSSASLDAGSQMTVTISRQKSTYLHTVTFAFGNRSYKVDNVADKTSYTIPVAWVDQIPSATSGTGQVKVDTYESGTLIGTNSAAFTLTVPSSVIPTVGDVTVDILDGKWGLCVQGYSRVKISAPKCAAGTGSSLSSVNISGAGYSVAANALETGTLETGILRTAGDITFAVTAMDARGRRATKNVSITVTAYTPITIANVTCYRSDADKVAQPIDGTCATLGCTYVLSAIGSNSADIRVAWRTEDIEWTELIDFPDASGETVVKMAGELSTSAKYEFRFTVTDGLSSVEQTAIIPSAAVFMRWDKAHSAIGFGCFPQGSNRVELDQWDLIVKGRDIDKTLDEIEENQNTMADAVEQRTRVRNLLDNSDFRNPVNQRSIPTGANNYSLCYTIDRWIYQSTSQTNSYFGLTNDYVSIAPPSVSGGYSEMFQRFEHWDASWVDLKGKTCTFAAKMHDNATGTWDVYTATLTMGDCAGGVSLDGTKSLMVYSVDSMHIAIRVFNNGNGGTADERCFMWFALYEGEFTKDTLPTYVPKGYAAELAECQRYFQKRTGQFPSLVSTSATRSYYIPFVVPMRISPTVSIWSGDEYNAWTKIGTYAGGTVVLDQAWIYGARLYGKATGQTASQPYWLWCDIVASADL